MVWIGALIVILTFVAIVRQYETRMVLFVSGLAMLLLGSGLLKGFVGAMDAFTKAMVNPGLVTVICMVMGFAYVMKLTKCDAHLVHFLAGGLGKLGPALIPGAVLVTFAIATLTLGLVEGGEWGWDSAPTVATWQVRWC